MNSLSEFIWWMCNDQNPHRKLPMVYSYSELSRRLGYKSRSFIREVAEKKRAPSLQLVQRLNSFLKCNSTWTHYFENIYKKEMTTDALELQRCETQIIENKNRIRKGLLSKKINTRMHDSRFYINDPDTPVIFAALGSPENGASVSEIQTRTHLKPAKIQMILDLFVEKKVVKTLNDRYYLDDIHIFLERFGNDEVFLSDIQNATQKIQHQSRQKQITKDELLFLSSFSISEKNLPELRKKLSVFVRNFIVENEEPNGDKVVNLSTFFTLNR